ncbi:CinA family protein [Curvivirga aplysinae]|uniref:CinA family protein n=1 Tax=Curvivirga aplysinae TaxID=2529852 RepID=UPI0012BCBF09|nr:CinA family protein [Curvivirga aplysinae]MTI10071.1 CinA family protein [Curvivirga aplysinae]
MFSKEIRDLSTRLLSECRLKKWTVSTAESCTGGLIAGALTEIAGSSDVVDRGFITYSNEAKNELIGVNSDTIRHHGAVSHEVAEQMAIGAIKEAQTNLAIAVTGVAGPGASENKPAGLVYIGIAADNLESPIVTKLNFEGNRSEVRRGTVRTALFLALSVIQKD